MKEKIQNYLNITNFGSLECPFCKSTKLIRWGSYERNVIFFSGDEIILESLILKVQRVRCKSCGKTHALLPIGIIPYKQFSDEVITRVINEAFNLSLDEISEKYAIELPIIKCWISDLKKKHLSRIIILMKRANKRQALLEFLINQQHREQYLINNNRCFMQNKLGYINLMPHLSGAPT